MKKSFAKIRMIFDIENWLWTLEIGTFVWLDLERTLICQKTFKMKKCYLPFDVEVAEKFTNGIYWVI